MSNIWSRARIARDHRWAPARMSDYLEGDLATRARQRLERHARDCEECRGALRGLQRMLGRLGGMDPPAERPNPKDMAARVRERLRERAED